MAMSQFSFGKLAALRRLGQQTPVPGGFDAQGNPTMDPAAILKGGHMLPIGYWKGVGLAVMLDVIAAALAGGNTTAQITAAGGEHAVSQVFLAIDTAPLGGPEQVARIAHDVVADLCAADPLDTARPVLYPGQRAMHSRQQSLAKGVPVDSEVWATIEQLHQTVKP
jgi:3-dehydro-L-gulonate 2-dehydrogenase